MNQCQFKLLEMRIDFVFSVVFRILFHFVEKLQIFFRIFLRFLSNEEYLRKKHIKVKKIQYSCKRTELKIMVSSYICMFEAGVSQNSNLCLVLE